jgi:hypothetical protein
VLGGGSKQRRARQLRFCLTRGSWTILSLCAWVSTAGQADRETEEDRERARESLRERREREQERERERDRRAESTHALRLPRQVPGSVCAWRDRRPRV